MLKFKPFSGPRRYCFVDPDTGVEFIESSKKLLKGRIRQYREANKLEEIENLDLVLEHYWCGLPENFGSCEFVERVPRGLFATLKGGVTLFSNVLYGKTVSQEVADERANQCAGCKYNILPADKGFEKFSNDLALAARGDKRTSRDDELGQCGACGCVLKMKVWYGDKIKIEPDWEGKMREVGCWQLKDK